MIRIEIRDQAGKMKAHSFDVPSIIIGRMSQNDLVLAKTNISKRHAQIERTDEGMVITDLGSTNGTYVNGERIDNPKRISEDDEIFIGEFIVTVLKGGENVESENSGQPRPTMAMGSRSDDDEAIDADVLREAMNMVLSDTGGPTGDQDEVSFAELDAQEDTRVPTEPSEASMEYMDEETRAIDPGEEFSGELDLNEGSEAEGEAEAEAEAESEAEDEPEAETEPEAEDEPEAEVEPEAEPEAEDEPEVVPEGDIELDAETMARIYEEAEAAVAGSLSKEWSEDVENEIVQSIGLVVKTFTESGSIPAHASGALEQALLYQLVDLGPIAQCMLDPEVTDVHICGPDEVYVRKDGVLEPSPHDFLSEEAFANVIERLLDSSDGSSEFEEPAVKGVLDDGSSFIVLRNPLSAKDTIVVVRREHHLPVDAPSSLDALVDEDALSLNGATLIRMALSNGRGVSVTGGTPGARACLIQALAASVPKGSNVVFFERGSDTLEPGAQVVDIDAFWGAHGDFPELAEDMAIDYAVVVNLRNHELGIDHGFTYSGLSNSALISGVDVSSAEALIRRADLSLSVQQSDLSAEARSALIASSFPLVIHLKKDADRAIGWSVASLHNAELRDGAVHLSSIDP